MAVKSGSTKKCTGQRLRLPRMMRAGIGRPPGFGCGEAAFAFLFAGEVFGTDAAAVGRVRPHHRRSVVRIRDRARPLPTDGRNMGDIELPEEAARAVDAEVVPARLAEAVTVAVDTNLLVRLLVADDPDQTERARRLFATSRIFVPITVLLECWWVLEAVYRVPPGRIAEAFRRLLGLADVTVEQERRVVFAIEAEAAGLDFADALHLAATPEGGSFATFDRTLLRRTPRIADAPHVFEPAAREGR